jgi:beta-glucosidase
MSDEEKLRPIYDVHYNEGVFVGYRWYEYKKIEPLYHFGEGLSYTFFKYSDLNVSKTKFNKDDIITVKFTISNTGKIEGMETAQLYIQDIESSVPRPVKELKGFKKVNIKSGESKTIELKLSKKDFSYWNSEIKDWYAEKGKFIIYIGSSSNNIRLKTEVELL